MSNTNTNGPTAISPDHVYLPLGQAIDSPGSTGYIQFDSDGVYIGNLKNGGLGSGTVTIVTVTSANGVSAVVTNANTTPDLTFTLGNITPTSVTASGNVTGANLSGTNTGDQTITLTGDVTGSGTGSFAATIANKAVTYAKIQDVSGASKLLGRGSLAGAGVTEEISIGSGLTLTGTTLSATGAGAGDVVGPASATDGAPALFDGTTGKLIKNSTPTGTGNPVLATSPTLTTPNLGTPSALVGTNITGTAPGLTAGNATTAAIATTVSVANEPSDATCFVCVFADPTGNLGPKTNTALTFNATSGVLAAAGFSGPLTGNVTGNVSGSSGACTGNAATATVLQTARDINGVSFNGSSSITIQVPVATGITGLGSGIATWLATPSSANLAAAITDETGSGALVFATSPTLVTPILGTPTSGALTNCSGLPIAGVTMATARLAGRTTAGSGSAEEITVGNGLSLSSGVLSAVPQTIFLAPFLTATNLPAAAQFYSGSAGYLYSCKADLSSYTQVRLIGTKGATTGAAGTKIILRYITTFSTTVGSWSDIGTSEVSVAGDVSAGTVLDTGWINLATLAKSEVFFCLITSGGDGAADPVFGNFYSQFK